MLELHETPRAVPLPTWHLGSQSRELSVLALTGKGKACVTCKVVAFGSTATSWENSVFCLHRFPPHSQTNTAVQVHSRFLHDGARPMDHLQPSRASGRQGQALTTGAEQWPEASPASRGHLEDIQSPPRQRPQQHAAASQSPRSGV